MADGHSSAFEAPLSQWELAMLVQKNRTAALSALLAARDAELARAQQEAAAEAGAAQLAADELLKARRSSAVAAEKARRAAADAEQAWQAAIAEVEQARQAAAADVAQARRQAEEEAQRLAETLSALNSVRIDSCSWNWPGCSAPTTGAWPSRQPRRRGPPSWRARSRCGTPESRR